jgi:exopolyphosphatase / guanosine-5'-triphosphate,3'-diphosphate pyrophosphatase
MRIGVIDVGSNTMRLLVAESGARGLVAVGEDRALVGLAEAIERRGWIPSEKLEEAAAAARGFASKARSLDCARLEMVVTAPGRQAVNAEDLLVALQAAAGTAPRVLSAEEEGRLAFVGAASSLADPADVLAVCDVGGGSTEMAVGAPGGASPWVASVDIGSLRLTERCLRGTAPGRRKVERAREEVRGLLSEVRLPEPAGAGAAVGGSARALAKMTAGLLTAKGLRAAIDELTGRSAVKVARPYGIGERRAATLLAGAVILEGVQERLDLPLQVAQAGLREGLASELLAARAAA